MDGINQTIADVLLSQKVISQENYNTVKLESENTNTPLEKLLVDKNIVTSEQLVKAKAAMLNIKFVDINSEPVSPMAISMVPEPVARRYTVLPVSYNKETNTLIMAMADPADLEAIEFIRQKTGAVITPVAAEPQALSSMIDEQYQQDMVKEVTAAVKETQPQRDVRTIEQKDLATVIKEAPIARILSTMLEYAIKNRASDIHIEPQEEKTRVRYRIDGILHERLFLPRNVQEAIVSRIKIISGMKIDERRIPQDGRFNFKIADEEVDLRVSSLPTVFGEKIVMRLLRKSNVVPTLTDLGVRGTALKVLEANMQRPHGIIIVCGPTGSGKTTTLYAVLSKINTPKVNISTLEDPVEYQITGVNQVQINPAVGLTFASGLRAFLRQDPNIILVGEIRDRETTDLAIQAALTGHLVFSTLHTSNAAGVLPRLLDLGAENFLLASTMNAIMGQRIVRKICSDCKESYIPPQTVVEDMKKVLGNLIINIKLTNNQYQFFKGRGCATCNNTGFLGRVGIFEVLQVSERIARLVLERADANTVEKAAIEDGMITMKQDGYLKVLEGITTIEEVLRVAQE